MTSASTATHSRPRRPLPWLLLGGIALATLDALFAIVFWVPRGVSVAQVFQSIATGVLGEAAYRAGAAAAWLGAGLHLAIAIAMVAIYCLVARRWDVLVRQPLRYGLPYGLALYASMNFVVLPLSAAGPPGFDNAAWVASSIVVHAILGVICALFSRKALLASPSTP